VCPSLKSPLPPFRPSVCLFSSLFLFLAPCKDVEVRILLASFYKGAKRKTVSSVASTPTNANATTTSAGSVPDFAKGKRRQRPRQTALTVRADVTDEQETPASRVGGPRLRLVEAFSRCCGVNVDPEAGRISFVSRRRWFRLPSEETIIIIIAIIRRMNHMQLRRGPESVLPGEAAAAAAAAAAKKGRGVTALISAALPDDRMQV